jgi:dolichyl-diphosphooligosaccharide--protein glycosyltransferase
MVFFPNIGKAKDTASQAPFAPSDAWYSSLSWLKENTPEPFGDADFYYHLETSKEYRPFKYPESAYGVMAWWDYGYWIARIAHRIPNANPGQEPQAVTRVAGFFTSQDEKSASKIVQEMGTAYVIIDYETATSKFWAIALWAGQERTDFFDTYYVVQEGKVVPINLFYPEYYRSMSTRLYSFDGKAVTPDTLRVISFQENTTSGGEVIKQITSVQSFSSYEEATAYIAGQQSANYRIISDNPFISPVPLEALEHYNLVHGSDVPIRLADGRTLPAVKIFEYVGP